MLVIIHQIEHDFSFSAPKSWIKSFWNFATKNNLGDAWFIQCGAKFVLWMNGHTFCAKEKIPKLFIANE